MMPEPDAASSECPTLEQIDRFVAGRTPDPELIVHLRGCARCRDEIERIRGNLSFLAGLGLPERLVTTPGSAEPLRVPGYAILEEIHRGGQGIVYRAVQLATNRIVAVKVLLHGTLATSKQRTRFEREIEIVAGLHHPGISTVYDSGLTADGRHFFAMEHIDGRPLDEHLRERRETGLLALEDLLRLFSRICDAVSHAHQRGVIHRDLKPANVLIDVEGRPHVLDFGLARPLEPGVDLPLVTASGEFTGTLAYASPEQVSGDPDAMDVRTDVYALGVLLYEILAGAPPYAISPRLDEMIRAIREDSPVPPSRRDGGAHRLDADLDTIVLKAMAKDPERRYQSVEQLRADVEHRLAGEPIDARRDSTWYLLRKTVRRHRTAVTVAAAFLVTLLVIAVTMTLLSLELARQRTRAEGAETIATEQADTAQRTADFVVNLLTDVNPWLSQGTTPEVHEMLLQGAERIDEIGGDPAAQARILNALGASLKDLGYLEEAIPMLERALELRQTTPGTDPVDLGHTLNFLGGAYAAEGRHRDAIACYEQAVTIFRSVDPPEPLQLARAYLNLAPMLLQVGDLAEAQADIERALAIRRQVRGEDHPDVAEAMRELAVLLRDRPYYSNEAADYETAERLLLEATELYRQAGDETKVWMGKCLFDLAWTRSARNHDPAEVLELCEQSLAIARANLPEGHHDLAAPLLLKGRLLVKLGRADEAEASLREGVAIEERLYDDDALPLAFARSYLADCLVVSRGPSAAEPYLIRSVNARLAYYAEDHAEHAVALREAIGFYEQWGRPELAEPFRQRLAGPDGDLTLPSTPDLP